MAPNEQNWEGDGICHSRTDSVCIGSCWMQPARLRPAEQECCTRRGVGAAWPSTLPISGWEAEADSRAAGPSWHLLHSGPGCGEPDFNPSCSELHTFLSSLPFSSPHLTYPWSVISLLLTLVQLCIPRGCSGRGIPAQAAFDNLHVQNSPLQQLAQSRVRTAARGTWTVYASLPERVS